MNTFFSRAAQENIQETGCDVEQDAEAIRAGSMTPEQLLNHCLDGADDDRRQGWLDYVNELCRAVYAESDHADRAANQRGFVPLTLPE